MKKVNAEIVNDAKHEVGALLKGELPAGLVYHTIAHTKQVVANAEKIGRMENFNEEELSLLLVAAWFHDVGYIKAYKGHEVVSAEMAGEFLTARHVDLMDIQKVQEAIRSTEITHQPSHKIGFALCDADFMHLSNHNYFDIGELLRQEWNQTGEQLLNKLEFAKVSVDIFTRHEFHTNYCKNKCNNHKERNLLLLKRKVQKLEKKQKINQDAQSSYPNKSAGYSRGVDSMFRMTARNQINLSSIADNKSNILISLNGIIISLGIAFLIRRFEETPEIILPTIVFLVFCLATIVLAILSTRPHISEGKFTREEIAQMKVNLLFFGSFYNMAVEDYEWAVKEMINNDKYLYTTMIKDQYYLGKVLARKYKLLRAAYSVFMFGLIISVSLFILVFIHVW